MTPEKRLIDANVLLTAIDEYVVKAYDCPLNEIAEFQSASNDTKVIYTVEGLYEATEIINEQPTVDAVEVVHGRWIRKQIGKYTGVDEVCCSNCGDFVGVVASDAGFREAIEGMNYCPNCGAKMDGGNGDGSA